MDNNQHGWAETESATAHHTNKWTEIETITMAGSKLAQEQPSKDGFLRTCTILTMNPGHVGPTEVSYKKKKKLFLAD